MGSAFWTVSLSDMQLLFVLAGPVLRTMVGRILSAVVRRVLPSVVGRSVGVLPRVGPVSGVREPRVGRQEVRLLYFLLSLLFVVSTSDRGCRPLERNILPFLFHYLNILRLCMNQQHG